MGMRAKLWIVAPLPNVLSTSARAETAFSILLLTAARAVERDRPQMAGAYLAVSCLSVRGLGNSSATSAGDRLRWIAIARPCSLRVHRSAEGTLRLSEALPRLPRVLPVLAVSTSVTWTTRHQVEHLISSTFERRRELEAMERGAAR